MRINEGRLEKPFGGLGGQKYVVPVMKRTESPAEKARWRGLSRAVKVLDQKMRD